LTHLCDLYILLTFSCLYSSATTRSLHSFPTRRSSDLVGGMGSTPVVSVVVMGVTGSGKTTVATELARRLGWDFTEGDDHHPAQRSEEHTSELQSRSDLVCRLLLEKKKKTQILNRTHTC